MIARDMRSYEDADIELAINDMRGKLGQTRVLLQDEENFRRYTGPRAWEAGTKYVFDGRVHTLEQEQLPLVPGTLVRVDGSAPRIPKHEVLVLERNHEFVLLANPGPTVEGDTDEFLQKICVDLDTSTWVRIDTIQMVLDWDYQILEHGKKYLTELTGSLGDYAKTRLAKDT